MREKFNINSNKRKIYHNLLIIFLIISIIIETYECMQVLDVFLINTHEMLSYYILFRNLKNICPKNTSLVILEINLDDILKAFYVFFYSK
jgi:hypothetical protein